MSEIDLKVSTRKVVNVRATIELEDGTRIQAKSMARGIRLAVRKPGYSSEDSLTVPAAAFDALGEVFEAVREKRAEVAE